jgi:hypothetical protein
VICSNQAGGNSGEIDQEKWGACRLSRDGSHQRSPTAQIRWVVEPHRWSLAPIAFADNYLIDVKFGIIMDVEATRTIRQAEVGAAKTMIERTEERFDIKPERLAADSAYGSAAHLNWLVNEKRIPPHIPVIDKSKRDDGTFSREDFTFDKTRNFCICPAFKTLTTTGKIVNDDQRLFRASKPDCDVCPFKMRCCPKEPARKIPRSIQEDARDVARALAGTVAFDNPVATKTCRDVVCPPSASSGLAVSGCAARAVRKTSSRSLRSLRTYAASRSSSPDRHHSPWRALPKRRIHQYQCVEATALSGRTPSKGTASPSMPRQFRDFCKICHSRTSKHPGSSCRSTPLNF